jgi:hypothetical protein
LIEKHNITSNSLPLSIATHSKKYQEIDKDIQPQAYRHMIDDILKRGNRQITIGDEYESTG